jgi:hypothetical protein
MIPIMELILKYSAIPQLQQAVKIFMMLSSF